MARLLKYDVVIYVSRMEFLKSRSKSQYLLRSLRLLLLTLLLPFHLSDLLGIVRSSIRYIELYPLICVILLTCRSLSGLLRCL